jgi:peptide/nickel transport system permease protein
MWWRFRKNKLAIVGAVIVIMFYLVAIFADVIATADPTHPNARDGLMPPQPIHWFNEDGFAPFVYGVKSTLDFRTARRVFTIDETKKIPVRFLAPGFEYKFLGIFPADLHLLGVDQGSGATAETTLFVLGTDGQGRDMWSRLIFGIRVSLSIGLAGVALSFLLGIVLGGVSGYFCGIVDAVIQRFSEVLTAIPKIPLWMALAAAIPRDWDVLQVYLAMTIVLSVVGWTWLGREIRGRLMSLRNEDFVVAAELSGAGPRRIIFVHLVPLFMSHIIASVTLAIPDMIGAETALSFLGLGLKAPAISLGVLLQDTQKLEAVVFSPWMMVPAIPVIIVVLAFNFFGDGLRDAADPYAI